MLYIFHVQKRKLNPRLETQTRQIFVVSGSLMLARIKAPRELNFNLFPRHIIKKKPCIFFALSVLRCALDVRTRLSSPTSASHFSQRRAFLFVLSFNFISKSNKSFCEQARVVSY